MYVQDKWTPIQKPYAEPGLRFQTGYSWVDTQPTAIATFRFYTVSGRDAVHRGSVLSRIRPIPTENVAPWVSAIYDLTGKGRSVLKFTANSMIPGNTMAGGSTRSSNDTRSWTVCKRSNVRLRSSTATCFHS